jgi:3-dehydroquinate synthase
MDKKIVEVKLGNRSYDIVIGNNILADFAHHLKKSSAHYSKIFVVTDKYIAKRPHLQKFSDQLNKSDLRHETIILPHGEKTKDFSHLQNLCEQILEKGIDRKTLLIAFGGGVIGDLCGFAASILLRGIDFIQVPTTFLAMVDSSVGGKTAINSKYGKNLIGSFYQPKLVFCDLSFLETLPEREFLSGYAEVLKYGLIRDLEFFEYLEKNFQKIKNRDVEVLKNLVKKSCEIKAEIVSADEKEQKDLRALLNFGHTFGHVFETETEYSDELRHGEAVAIGMVLAAKLSMKICGFEKNQLDRIENHLQKIGLPISALQIRKSWDVNQLISHLYKDKKTEKGKLTFIVLKKIGEALVQKNVEEKLFAEVINNS